MVKNLEDKFLDFNFKYWVFPQYLATLYLIIFLGRWVTLTYAYGDIYNSKGITILGFFAVLATLLCYSTNIGAFYNLSTQNFFLLHAIPVTIFTTDMIVTWGIAKATSMTMSKGILLWYLFYLGFVAVNSLVFFRIEYKKIK